MECTSKARVGAVVMIVAWTCGSFVCPTVAADWPMLGRDGTRNGVSAEDGAPIQWSLEERMDLRDADVIALYLLPQQLEKLSAQLEKLKPGTRIVSHQFAIPGISPDKTVKVESREDSASHTLYLWTLPRK